MALTVPAGELTTGVVYDYLRLELDENHIALPAAAPAASTGQANWEIPGRAHENAPRSSG